MSVTRIFVLSSLLVLTATACGSRTQMIRGTEIPATDRNQQVIKVLEEYRAAIERRDTGALALMASKKYRENSGTPAGKDDYGYEGLQQVLATRFQTARDIRYTLRYVKITHREDRAFVDVIIDASWSIKDATGQQRREDKRDHNQLVLVQEGNSWKFLRGM